MKLNFQWLLVHYEHQYKQKPIYSIVPKNNIVCTRSRSAVICYYRNYFLNVFIAKQVEASQKYKLKKL